HWAYDGMGPAYKNTGVRINLVSLGADTIQLPGGLNPRDYFVPGDLVKVTNTLNREWRLCHVYEGAGQRLNLIDLYSGDAFEPTPSFPYSLEVIRSGRRNLHNVPVQQISTMHYPISSGYLSVDSVLSASAV